MDEKDNIHIEPPKSRINNASIKSKKQQSLENAAPLLMILVFLMFLAGFIQSIASLPDVSLDPNFKKMNDIKTMSSAERSLMKWPIRDPKIIPKAEKLSDFIVVDSVTLPRPKWPVSIRDEDGDFEDIVHPGDKKTIISVPKFWSGPLMNGELMTVKVAASIGTYINGKTDKDLENKGPADERTIFVAIASYRDYQCRETVESIFNRAKFPNRVRVAVVDQITDEDPSCGAAIIPCTKDPSQALCRYKNQVDVLELEAQLAVGPIFARHLGHRLYRGEYYSMQIDAHVTFVQDWDADIISQFESAKNEMAVISTYLTDIEGSIDENGYSLRKTRPIMCNTDYEGNGKGRHLRHLAQPEARVNIKDMPQLQPYWAAGWSFSRGHFVVNVPYDLYAPMVFMGEEMSIGIRGFTYGYDHYASLKSICFHTYAHGPNTVKRNKVPKYWENTGRYQSSYLEGMKRLLGIIKANPDVDPSEWRHEDEDFYGIGKERDPMKFYETFGIDVKKKQAQHHLCSFVQTGKMHRDFLKYLRPNGMGIDYSQIDYKFVDPRPGEK